MAVRITLLVLVLASVGVSTAFADHLIGAAIPGSEIVARGGLEWVYANPCPPAGCPAGNGVILDYRGWSIPTPGDFIASFADQADLNAAFTGLCASAYFDDSDDYDHCDASWNSGFGDFDRGDIWNDPFAPLEHDGFEETLLVRGRAVTPEPATLALLGTGIVALYFRKRFGK